MLAFPPKKISSASKEKYKDYFWKISEVYDFEPLTAWLNEIGISKNNFLEINAENESIIQLFGTLFYGKTSSNSDFIKTIVVLNKVDFERIEVLNTSEYKKNENGLPMCLNSNKPISVSHHGRFKEIIVLY